MYVTDMMFSYRLFLCGNICIAKYLIYASVQQTLTEHLLCTRYTTVLKTGEGIQAPGKGSAARADG